MNVEEGDYIMDGEPPKGLSCLRCRQHSNYIFQDDIPTYLQNKMREKLREETFILAGLLYLIFPKLVIVLDADQNKFEHSEKKLAEEAKRRFRNRIWTITIGIIYNNEENLHSLLSLATFDEFANGCKVIGLSKKTHKKHVIHEKHVSEQHGKFYRHGEKTQLCPSSETRRKCCYWKWILVCFASTALLSAVTKLIHEHLL